MRWVCRLPRRNWFTSLRFTDWDQVLKPKSIYEPYNFQFSPCSNSNFPITIWEIFMGDFLWTGFKWLDEARFVWFLLWIWINLRIRKSEWETPPPPLSSSLNNSGLHRDDRTSLNVAHLAFLPVKYRSIYSTGSTAIYLNIVWQLLNWVQLKCWVKHTLVRRFDSRQLHWLDLCIDRFASNNLAFTFSAGLNQSCGKTELI